MIGERDTKARSDLPPDPNAPKLPSISGVDPSRPDTTEIRTFDSSFQDGDSVGGPPQKPSEARPSQTSNEVTKEASQQGDPQEPVEPLKPVETQEVVEAQEVIKSNQVLEKESPPERLGEDLLVNSSNSVPVTDLDGVGEERKPESLPREKRSEPDPLSKSKAGGEPEKKEEQLPKKAVPEQDPGFRGEVRKTRLRGSIGRNGPASAEVKNTPLGRYQALLSRAVEREWQKQCIRYRDHITPGILTIRFLVDEKGAVSGMRFIEVVEAGAIQKGFTLNAIKAAPIPAMPPALAKDLDGEDVELIFNFYF